MANNNKPFDGEMVHEIYASEGYGKYDRIVSGLMSRKDASGNQILYIGFALKESPRYGAQPGDKPKQESGWIDPQDFAEHAEKVQEWLKVNGKKIKTTARSVAASTVKVTAPSEANRKAVLKAMGLTDEQIAAIESLRTVPQTPAQPKKDAEVSLDSEWTSVATTPSKRKGKK